MNQAMYQAEVKQKYADSSEAVRLSQVDEQMSSMSHAVDMLHAVSEELMRRLESVTQSVPAAGTDRCGGQPCAPLVPLASRLSNHTARIQASCDLLRSLLSGLEV